MTETEQKALKVLNEVRDERGFKRSVEIQREDMAQEALCRAIYCNEVDQADLTKLQNDLERALERHEAFRQEVSDAVLSFWKYTDGVPGHFERFIIAKTDPLVEALNDMKDGRAGPTTESYAACLRAALAARGLEVRKIGEGE